MVSAREYTLVRKPAAFATRGSIPWGVRRNGLEADETPAI